MTPESWHQRVPKEMAANLVYRKEIINRALQNADIRQGLIEACRLDRLFFIDCIAEGTLVLTNRGPVPIERVTKDDLVWDGESWTPQDGPIFRGLREVIFAYNIYLTHDHKVRTDYGWQNASCRYDREKVRTPDSPPPRRPVSGHEAGSVALSLRMRERENHCREYAAERDISKLRMPTGAKDQARHERDADLCSLVEYVGAMHESKKSRLRRLWRSRNQGVRTLGKVRPFLRGHGGASVCQDTGPDRQRKRILKGKLSLGDTKRASEQHPGERVLRHPIGPLIDGGNCESGIALLWRGSAKSRQGFTWRGPRRTKQKTAKVYDLLNCGPRQCFTVVDSEGELLLVHNCFGWQFNPDKQEKGPFICRPDQEKILIGGEVESAPGVFQYQYGLQECIKDRESVRCPKSRYVGFTWLVCFTAVAMCLFDKNVKFLIMSKDEDTANDRDNPDSIFWKILFILEHLPTWMIDREQLRDRKTAIRFPNGNTITSTANVASAGVGGRATVMVIDEFGQFTKGHEVYSMTRDTSGCRIFVYTHKGRGTMAYELGKNPTYSSLRTIVTHWSHDPAKRRGLYRVLPHGGIEVIDKNYEYPPGFKLVKDQKPAGGPFPFIRSPWYDKECLNRSDYDIAMNLDIDPDGSAITVFDGYKIGVLRAECRAPTWQGNLEYDKEAGKPLRLVPDPRGRLKMWVVPQGSLQEDGSLKNPMLPKMRAGAGSDIAAGTGATPSCLSVADFTTGEKILSYEDADIFDVDFAVFCAAALRMIVDQDGKNPLLAWEQQGGQAFEKRLVKQLGYRNIYVNRENDSVGRAKNVTGRAGVSTADSTRLKTITEYRDAIYNGRYHNPDEHALKETLYFVYTAKGCEYQGTRKLRDKAESGASIHHGDIVQADAISYKMLCELGFDRPEFHKRQTASIPDTRTSAFREWLAEKDRREAEDEVWA